MTLGVHQMGQFDPNLVGSKRPDQIVSKDVFVGLYSCLEVLAIIVGSQLLLLAVRNDLFLDVRYISVSGLLAVVYSSLVYFNAAKDSTGTELTNAAERLKYWVFAALFCLTLAFAFKVTNDFSRLWAGLTVTLGSLLIIALHRFAKKSFLAMVRNGSISNRAMIYGGTDRTQSLMNTLTSGMPTLDILGVIDVRKSRFKNADIASHRGKSFPELIELIKLLEIEIVVLDLPWSAESRIKDIKRQFEAVDIEVLLAPYHQALFDDAYDVVSVGPNDKALCLYRRKARGLSPMVKTTVDKIGAGIGLLLLSPILLLTALAIKLESKGPVFFMQPRQGLNNQPFLMYKFRSMHTAQSDVSGNVSASRTDPRITRVGKFIRKWSLDELPQFLNVLKGDMSLVGPRPHAHGSLAGDKLFIDVADRYAARHRVLPGMTGLAQVRGHRGATSTEKQLIDRVHSDLEYIKRWNLFLDFEILLRTVVTVLNPKNAY